jgi:hypothetical protein
MSDPAALRGEHAPGLIPLARAAFSAWIEAAGAEGRSYLQLHVRAAATGRFRVRHLADRDADAATLETMADPYAARAVAQTTEEGAHRPLKTAPDLRRGWTFERLDANGLWTVLDYLYPASAVHWYAERERRLRVTHWSETAGRQSGMYSAVKLLPERAVRLAVRACCGDAVCLRRVAWGWSGDVPTPIESEPTGDSELSSDLQESSVPCPEACSIFISFARAILPVERSPRASVPGLDALAELELQQIEALVAAADGTAHAPRSGEFDDPLNRRRLRYLGARLAALRQEGAGNVP